MAENESQVFEEKWHQDMQKLLAFTTRGDFITGRLHGHTWESCYLEAHTGTVPM